MIERVQAKRVLLVDDDHAVRMMLGRVITLLGFDVTYAVNGKVALELYDSADGDFDLLITDICMPEMNGNDLVCEIRKRDERLPVIAITGFAESELIGQMKSYNVQLFEKPIDIKALRARIELLQKTMDAVPLV